MTELTRDARLLRTFAMLADTLVDDYDVVDLLQTLVDACRDNLGADAAGILLTDRGGALELIASTSDASRLVETMQLAAEAGPCVECFLAGAPVSVASIADTPDEWAAFRASALSSGFASADAIPCACAARSSAPSISSVHKKAPPTGRTSSQRGRSRTSRPSASCTRGPSANPRSSPTSCSWHSTPGS